MHVLQMKSVRYVVYTIAVTIVMEAFLCHQTVNFLFGCKSSAFNIWLSQDSTEQTIVISSESDNTHYGFGEQKIVECNGFEGTSECSVY